MEQPMNTMQRYLPSDLTIEERADKMPLIHGYAAVYHQKDDPGTQFTVAAAGVIERVIPGAFDEVISGNADVVALFNHDLNRPLGRTSAGTLTLSNDARGLRYSIDPPDTQYARDLVAGIQRGDIRGSSFGFYPPKRGETAWKSEGNQRIRELRTLRIRDVGPATTGAYASADTWVRSEADLAEIMSEADAIIAEEAAAMAAVEAVAAAALRIAKPKLSRSAIVARARTIDIRS